MRPRVLIRSDFPEISDSLTEQFAGKFDLSIVRSDSEALQCLSLDSAKKPFVCACILISNPAAEGLSSALLPELEARKSGIKGILLSPGLDLPTLSQVPATPGLDHAFPWPCDIEALAAEIYAAHFQLQPGRESEVAGTDPLILLVDDETTATRYLSRQLQQRQPEWQLLTAADAAEAYRLIEQDPKRVAVVMSDHRMPGTSGQSFLEDLRLRYPHIVRILTSAYRELDVALRAVNRSHIFRYVAKPWQLDEVTEGLTAALAEYGQEVENTRRQREATRQLWLRQQQTRQEMLELRVCSEFGESVKRPLQRFIGDLQNISRSKERYQKQRPSEEPAATGEDDLLQDFLGLLLPALHRIRTLPVSMIRRQSLELSGVERPGPVTRHWLTLLRRSALSVQDLTIRFSGERDAFRVALKEGTRFRILHPLFHDSPRPVSPDGRRLNLDAQVALCSLYVAFDQAGASWHFEPAAQGFRLQVDFPTRDPQDE